MSPRGSAWLAFLVIGSFAISAASGARSLEPAPPGVDVREIAQQAEKSLRSDRMFFEATMSTRKTRRARPRVLRFRSFVDRPRRRTFIRVLAPSKQAGTSFLLLTPNLWQHQPREQRTTRIETAAMSGPWMEGSCSIDDLVLRTDEVDDYDHRLLGIDPSPEGVENVRAWVLEYLPRTAAAVSRGRIVAWIETEHGTPLRQEFRDDEGDLLRLLRYEDFRPIAGRYFPYARTCERPSEKSGTTRIEVDQVRFDADFEDSVFTTTNLTSND